MFIAFPFFYLQSHRTFKSNRYAFKLVAYIAEMNSLPEELRNGRWERDRHLYDTDLPFDTWKLSAVRDASPYYYEEIFGYEYH